MTYFVKYKWNPREVIEIKYISNEFKDTGKAVYSVQKTFDEGIDIIRSIHKTNGKYLIISISESRSSGPAEANEGNFEDLDSAQKAVVDLCKEDDEYYK